MGLGKLAPLRQQLQRCQPPLARDNFVMLTIARCGNGEILQQADAGDA